MTETPVLTVGIPVYNEEYSIVNAVASVLNQTWPGLLEILVVDDGSTDDTHAVLSELSKEHGVIRVARHPENRGRPAARTTLMEEARGEYFAMLDADDEWYPDKLQRQFDYLAERSTETDVSGLMICGNLFHIDLDDGTEKTKDFAKAYGQREYDIRRVLKGDNTPISQVALLKTAFMRRVGAFDPMLARAQDWDFLIRFFAAGGSVEFLDGPPLAMFNFTRRGRSAKLVGECMNRVIDKHRLLYDEFAVDADMVRQSILRYIQSFEHE